MMYNIHIEAEIEEALEKIDKQIEYCNNVQKKIDCIKLDIDNVPIEIDRVLAELKYLQNLPKRLEVELKKVKDTESEIVSSWDGTLIKEDDDDVKDITHKPRKIKRRKNQTPCGNHTYKDYRNIKPESRKFVKKYIQGEIVKDFAESFRAGYIKMF